MGGIAMRVFISWSKEPSRTVAAALHGWLPDVIQSVEPWMSSTDIRAGARWSAEIAENLASTKIGILCVTPDNQGESWLLFEAGALAKTLEGTFVCPYLIQMPGDALAQGPLTQFQAKHADQAGTLSLLTTINAALGPEGLLPDRLQRSFERAWPSLEASLISLPAAPQNVQRPEREVLDEILETVRSLARRLPEPSARSILDRYREAWRPSKPGAYRDLAAQLEAQMAARPQNLDVLLDLIRRYFAIPAEDLIGTDAETPKNNPTSTG